MSNSNNSERWNVSLQRNTQIKPSTKSVSKDKVVPPLPAIPIMPQEKPYYDKNYLEIGEGDLLKVYHFKSRNKTYYMYQTVVLNNGVWQDKDYHKDGNIGHYNLLSTADKLTRVISTAEIISKKDWENEGKLRREARKRKKEYEKRLN